MTLPLSPQVFAILSSLVEERLGLHYGLDQKDLFADRVSVRAEELGIDSLLDYYYHLRYDERAAAEFLALAETLVVNETFFFRELDQLEALVRRFLLPRASEQERLRIWCAASSTGEEPYTIAMLLAEAGLLRQTEIVASDLSQRVLEKARAGSYTKRSLRAVTDRGMADRWLRVQGDRVLVHPDLVRAVDFRQVNLVDAHAVERLGTFDAIVCRNVLIYFRDEVARAVVTRLAERLAPGGALVVGVSESLLRFGTDLECEELAGAFIYRRRR